MKLSQKNELGKAVRKPALTQEEAVESLLQKGYLEIDKYKTVEHKRVIGYHAVQQQWVISTNEPEKDDEPITREQVIEYVKAYVIEANIKTQKYNEEVEWLLSTIDEEADEPCESK